MAEDDMGRVVTFAQLPTHAIADGQRFPARPPAWSSPSATPCYKWD